MLDNRTSRFWMGDDVAGKKVDVIELLQYRRAISNFVSIVTGENIPVRFHGQQSATDGKTVTLSADIKNNEMDVAVALALHEGSHILLSDFNHLKDLMGNFEARLPLDIKKALKAKGYMPNDIQMAAKGMLNVIEDRRIDAWVFNNAPGYKGYYKALYEKFFRNDEMTAMIKDPEYRDENFENYLNHMIAFIHPNRNLKALGGLQTIYDIVDLGNIARLKTSTDAWDVTCDVLREIINHVDDKATADQKKEDKKQDNGDDAPQDANGDGQGQGGQGEDEEGDAQDGNGDGQDEDTDGDDAQGNASGEGDDQDGDTGMSAGNNTEENTNAAGTAQALKDLIDLVNGEMEKAALDESQDRTLDAMDQAKSGIKKVGKDLNATTVKNGGVDCIVHNAFTKTMIGTQCSSMINSYKDKELEAAVAEGLQLGKKLGKLLKVRQEARPTTNVRQKSGRIDGRILAEIGAGNGKVFSKTFLEQFSDATVHISIDASGSMGGRKFETSIVTSTAIAKAASMTKGLAVSISFRSTYRGKPEILIAYDSNKDHVNKIKTMFPYLEANGLTPEGLCFEAILKDVIKPSNRNLNSIFVNFSDGEPSMSVKQDGTTIRYDGTTATQHTKRQVDKMKKMGVTVLSYFIDGGWGNSIDNFKEMYGRDAQFINPKDMKKIANTLNKKFLEKA